MGLSRLQEVYLFCNPYTKFLYTTFLSKSTIDLITNSLLELFNLIKTKNIKGKIYLPFPGIGNGGLNIHDIKGILFFISWFNS
ncbi:hypothetical protein [Deferribacter desulfuricans]|uniref:hypothetical protein n=1 Tax=Deferribacter desulfuricans TaxID=197162 RepID=UPI00059C83DF|nr:hypothetical protein [Deferribacter desulfuricans]